MAKNPRFAKVAQVRRLTPVVREVTFSMIDPPQLQQWAGQYIILHTAEVEGKPVKRAFSLASAALDTTRFSLCVHRVEDGPASCFVHQLQPGDKVTFSGPWGKWEFDLFNPSPVIMLASGAGISPLRAMLNTYLPQNPAAPFILFWQPYRDEELYYLEEFAALEAAYPSFSFRPSTPSKTSGGEYPVVEALSGLEELLPRARFYLSGSGEVIAECLLALQRQGVSAGQVFIEAFFAKEAATGALSGLAKRESVA